MSTRFKNTIISIISSEHMIVTQYGNIFISILTLTAMKFCFDYLQTCLPDSKV